MSKTSTIELHKENMKFSAGHFTIFSATERERLHGHNYTVFTALKVLVDDQGLTFDYRYYKTKLYNLCKSLNQAFLLPANSKYLTLEEQGVYIYAHFNQEKIPFLKNDVIVLPLTNITLEELSSWFVAQLTADKEELSKNKIQEITVKVYSGPGQSSSASWSLVA